MSDPIRVLIIEDRPADAELMLNQLRQEGFDPDWSRVDNEPDFLAALETKPDLILADWSLPQFSGLRALQLMNERGLDIAFVVVSGSIGEEEAVQAMHAGADDYLLKDRLARLGTAARNALEVKHLRELRKQEQAALRASEDKFKHIFEYSSVGNSITQFSGEINVNQALCDLLGYTPQELQNKKWQDLTHPDDIALTQREVDRLLNGEKESVRFNKRYLKKDGSVLWVDLSSSIRRDALGSPLYMMTTLIDISERKQAEEKLEEERSLLQTVIDNLPARVFAKDDQGRKILSNKEDWQASGGKTMEDVIGKTDFDTYPPELAKGFWADDKRVIDSGESILNHEEPGLDSQGNRIMVLSSTVPLRNSHGKVIGLVGVGQDITERTQKEEEVRESQQLLKKTLSCLLDAVFILDADTVEIKDCNQAATAIFGYSREEMLGKTTTFLHVDQAALEEFRQHLEPAVEEKGYLFLSDFRMKRKDATIFPTENSVIPILDGQGKRTGWVSVVRDITERKQAEEHIVKLNRMLHVLSDINQAIVRLRGGQALYQEACHIAVDEGNFSMAWIGFVDPETKDISPVTWAGSVGDYLDKLKINVGDDARGYGPTGTSLREGQHKICNDIEHEEWMKPWRPDALKLGYRSSAAFPLQTFGAVSGVFTVYASEPGFFDEEEIRLLDELAQDISFAMEFTERDAQRKQAEELIKESTERMHEAQKLAHIGVWDWKPEPDTVTWTEELYHIVGLDPLLPAPSFKEHSKLYTPESWELLKTSVEKALETGEAYQFELELIRPNGERRCVNAFGGAKFDPKGKVIGLFGTLQDITERKRVEQALRRSEEEYRLLIENSHDIIYTLTSKGIFTFASPAWTALLGHPVDQVTGQSFQEFVHPDDLAGCMAWLQKVIETGQRQEEVEYRVRHTDGSWRWHTSSGVPIRDEAGAIVGFEGIARDITERKQTEKALRESEERFRSLYENATIGMYRTEPGGRILMANPALLKMLGYDSFDELARRDLSRDGYEPEYPRQEFQALIEQHGEVRGLEARWKHKDGSTLYVRESAHLVRDEKNQPLYYEGTVEDITDRKQVEEALRESENRYQLVFENSGTANTIFDTNCRAVLQNSLSRALSGPGEAIGKTALEIFGPEQGALVTERMRRVLASGVAEVFETDFSMPVGRKWMRSSYLPLLDEHKGMVGIQVISQDITTQKQAEITLQEYSVRLEADVAARTRELQEAQEQLVRQEKLAVLGQLAGSVGHELRNPLGVINSAVYYLKLVQPEAPGKIQEYHAKIEQEVRNADKIITDLLDFARVKGGEPEQVSVDKLVRSTLVRFPVPEGVELALELPENLPAIFVDPRQMEQVLGNLVVNACQAMLGSRTASSTGVASRSTATGVKEGGKLTITSEQSSVTSEQWVRISVKDTGTGITPENMQKLFEPLFTTKTRGIGLGLAVSRKLTEANGGRIEVESEVGKGSTFTLYLPVVG